MKSLTEQLTQKCIHFNGVGNVCCDAGIFYADVRDETQRPFRFPCRGDIDSCAMRQFPSEQEVEKQMARITEMGNKVLTARILIDNDRKKTKQDSGAVDCTCGGKIFYAVADNGHIRASCKGCGMSFME